MVFARLMCRAAIGTVLLTCAVQAWGGDAVQPVMVPQAELMQHLDPGKEWLLLPVSDWRHLMVMAHGIRVPTEHAGAGLISGTVLVSCDANGCSATAVLQANVDAGAAAAVPLFACAPERLDRLSVGGAPGMLVTAAQYTDAPMLLLPGTGTWQVGAQWSQASPVNSAAGWSASIPLPLSAALDVTVQAPVGWAVRGDGLIADGAGRWRLIGAHRGLSLQLRPADSRAVAWGVTQHLAVQLADAAAGGTFSWSLASQEGNVPEQIAVHLPVGFIATSPSNRIQPDGSVLLRTAADADQQISGIVSIGAPIDLPTVGEATWSGGIVEITVQTTDTAVAAVSLTTPAGWIPLAPVPPTALSSGVARRYAVARSGSPVALTPLAIASGVTVRASAAIAVGGGLVRASWALEMSSSQPIHQIHATIPSGWRIVAADAGTGALNLPPADEIQRKDWPLTIDLARALSAGGSRTLLITLERPSQDRVAVVAPSVEGAVRTSHRVLIAADPATAVSLAFAPGPSWRLGPPATSTGTLEAVAELLATDGAPPLTLAIHPRLARVEAEAACWLLPRGDDTRVRLDLRLRVAGGALDSIAIELPTALNATDGAPAGSTTQGWRVESPGAVLTTDGTSMRLGWPALWSGERLVRLSARMLANAGRTAAVRPHLSADGRATPLRLDVVALSGDGIDVEALPIGRNLEADELPSWSAPPPGTHILAAWRPPLDGETGSVTTRVPHLHDGPIGYLDQVRLFTQIGPGGATTLMLARLAAPGLSALPLQLPPGMILEQALIDGEDAPVRKDADGLAVMLAGHTQVQLALRLIQPASPGLLTLEAPVISIPWLRTSWTVGVASAWHAVPVASSTLSLRALDEIPPRGFLGSWQAWSGVVDVSDSILEQSAAPEIPTDPRYLHGPSVLPPPLQRMREPTLALIGARLSGSRIGPATAIQLEIASVDALNQHDRIGRFLGVIAVTILACLAWVGALALWRMACVCLASALAAAAMVCAQMPCFGLLGVCEAITILAPLVMLLIWWRRSRAAPASAMRGTKGNV